MAYCVSITEQTTAKCYLFVKYVCLASQSHFSSVKKLKVGVLLAVFKLYNRRKEGDESKNT